MGLVHRLYHGETTFPLIRQRKKFYAASLLLCLVALVSITFRGFNLGVEFKGGGIFQLPVASNVDVKASRSFVESLGVKDAIVQTVKSSGGATQLRVETEPLSEAQANKVAAGLATHFSVNPNQVNSQAVGASWGKQVTKKALEGLIVFLFAVMLYISFRFEPKMAASAIIALIHDLLLAAGIYSITGFVVTPSTVIALLTVLGYSLYDTVVVFDRIRDNASGLGARNLLDPPHEAARVAQQRRRHPFREVLLAPQQSGFALNFDRVPGTCGIHRRTVRNLVVDRLGGRVVVERHRASKHAIGRREWVGMPVV